MINKIYKIKRRVYFNIVDSFANTRTEQDGIIGLTAEQLIGEFFADKKPIDTTVSSYIPNVQKLNKIINKEWSQKNIRFIGFVHSHIRNADISDSDIKYAQKILDKLRCYDHIIMGIALINDTGFEDKIQWYRIDRKSCTIIKVSIV